MFSYAYDVRGSNEGGKAFAEQLSEVDTKMSVLTMAAAASEPTRVTAPAGEDAVSGAARLIVTYIPSEAVAVYLALLGLLIPVAGTPSGQIHGVKLIAFGAGLLLAGALAWFGFSAGSLSASEALKRRALLVVFAAVAFFAYSVSTPGGPWSGVMLGIDATVWGAALVIVLGPCLPFLAKRLGLRP